MGEKCGFPLVSFFDADVVVTPADVYNCEFGASAEVIYDLGNEGGYVSILPCPFIDGSVVLYWS